MKIHQIRAFLAVCKTGNLKNAAQDLHLTQPALSKSIKELELQYGVALFERSGNGLTLTPYGEKLSGYARMMNETARRAKQDIDTMKGQANSLITVGVSPVASLIKSLNKSFNEFHRRHPEVTVRILEMRPRSMLEHLRQGEIDFTITSQLPIVDNTFEWQAICRIPNIVVVRKSHPLRNSRSLRSLHQSEWISLDNPNDTSTYFYQLFALNGLNLPNQVRECSSMGLVLSLLKSADLTALFTSESLELEYIRKEVIVLPIVDNIPDSVISMVTLKRDIMTESAKELFDLILQDLREVYPEFN